ncbi:MAG TPA: DUF763 domain-containing protein [Longimicrobiales bacterium]|nr:DUF763 domain-containing protein [Longimicrobiales bacterium]
MSRRTGSAILPLHGGRAPRWLFERMAQLAPAIVEAIVVDRGPAAVLERLSDPYWFQAFGCVLGFDWHSSGVTTTVCGALKQGLAGREADTGIHVAGGKGRTSLRTPVELEAIGARTGLDGARLAYHSRMSAKVDSAAVQDGFGIYHHSFFVTSAGEWAVVQQGMRPNDGSARRYHWLGARVSDLVCEPHAAVCSDATQPVLNFVATESAGARVAVTKLANEEPARVARELGQLLTMELPRRHWVDVKRDVHAGRVHQVLLTTYERRPADFEALLATPGIGPAALRALSLVAEVVYGEPTSTRDPARFSFAHGGKDGHPFPVDRTTYDHSIAWLRDAVTRAKLGNSDRADALRKLASFERRAEEAEDTRSDASRELEIPRAGAEAPRAREAQTQLNL